jgi:ribosome-binding factor A
MSKRIEQLNSLVQQEVAGLVARQIEFPLGTMVTVSGASVADDAESAKIWISVLPVEKSQLVMGILQGAIREIQRHLNRKLVMKFVPKITFVLDTAQERAAHVNAALDHIEEK